MNNLKVWREGDCACILSGAARALKPALNESRGIQRQGGEPGDRQRFFFLFLYWKWRWLPGIRIKKEAYSPPLKPEKKNGEEPWELCWLCEPWGFKMIYLYSFWEISLLSSFQERKKVDLEWASQLLGAELLKDRWQSSQSLSEPQGGGLQIQGWYDEGVCLGTHMCVVLCYK